jgi:CubicO group peptidase (beta-lactamase class C family)
MRRPFPGVLLFIAMAVTACTADTDRGPEPSGTRSATTCDPKLHSAFRSWEEAGFSGSIAISTRGRFDCLAGFGLADKAKATPNTADTVFSIGSVTKSFTAAAVVDLAEQKRFALDDPVGQYLPELSSPISGLTIRQLLLHTSGLRGTHGSDYKPMDRDAAISAINRLDLAFPPGTDNLYSNAGYSLLALLIEKVSGKSYRDHTVAEILTLPDGKVTGGFWNGVPAAPGARAVGYHDDGTPGKMGDFTGPHWALDGNGSLAMSTRDLATWTHALFSGQVVSARSVNVISSPGADLGDGQSETPGWAAHDKSVLGVPLLAAAGGGGDEGHNVVVAWMPQREQVVAIASNTPDLSAEQLLEAVGRALVNGKPLPTPEPIVDQPIPADAKGSYQLTTGGSFDLDTGKGKLSISANGADAVAALFPPRDDEAAREAAAHETRVSALLDGKTLEGSQARAELESNLGSITAVAVVGTIMDGDELRTYLTITTSKRTVTGWYAVDDEGGIQAAEAPTRAPTLRFLPAGGTSYRPDDPTDRAPDVTVTLGPDRLTVSGPGGTTVAERVTRKSR